MLNIALRYFVAAVLLAGAAGLLRSTGRLERRIAEADQALATLELGRAARGYVEVADALPAAGQLPWLLPETRRTLAARQAAVQYWQGDNAALADTYLRPDSPGMGDNRDLRFVVANAEYRSVQRPDANRELALGALDHAVGVYRRLLEGTDTHPGAAFNFELMVRLRTQIASGGDVPAVRPPTVPGNPGDTPEEAEMEDVQIYVPRDSLIDPDDSEVPTIGEGAPIRKRG